MAFSLSACRHDPPPPLLSYGDRACTATPDLSHAVGLALDPEKPANVTFDAKTPCMQTDGGAKSVYQAFRLPNSSQPYYLGIDSAVDGTAVLAPRALFLDSQGAMLRTVSGEDFTFHGAGLHAGVRVHPNEVYVVVASDPDRAGKQVSRIGDNVYHSYYGSGALGIEIHTGSEETQTLTYSLNGSVSVEATPVGKP